MLLTKDKDFYRTFWRLFFMIVLQNAIVLSVNLADSAIAANSIASTLFQLLKVMAVGAASATAIIIGKTVGKGDMDKLREYVRTFQCIFLCISLVTGVMPFAIAL